MLKDLRANKILVADIQCLTAAFLFGIGFLGQREISIDSVGHNVIHKGLGPMTCNAFRFGLSTLLLAFCLPFLPRDGPSDKVNEIDDSETSSQITINNNNDSLNNANEIDNDIEARLIKKEVEQFSKSTKINHITIPINKHDIIKLLFSKKSIWVWGITLGTLNFLGSGFQQV